MLDEHPTTSMLFEFKFETKKLTASKKIEILTTLVNSAGVKTPFTRIRAGKSSPVKEVVFAVMKLEKLPTTLVKVEPEGKTAKLFQAA